MSILHITDLIGIISFALNGFLIASRQGLDILGIILLSFLTALGGGIIRDVIVNKLPYSFTHSLPSIVVLLTIIFAIIFKLYKQHNIERKTLFIISDSIGLVSFSITGALIGLEFELNFFGVILLSLLTAVGGGIIRDMLINEVPFILVSDFYGIVSVLISISLYFLHMFNFSGDKVIVFVFILGLMLRLVAYYNNWRLPLLKREKK